MEEQAHALDLLSLVRRSVGQKETYQLLEKAGQRIKYAIAGKLFQELGTFSHLSFVHLSTNQ